MWTSHFFLKKYKKLAVRFGLPYSEAKPWLQNGQKDWISTSHSPPSAAFAVL